MAKIADILKIEQDRQEPEKWNVIHLFKEGPFWHGHEWSAWLIKVVCYTEAVREQTKDKKVLRVIHKQISKNEATYVFVGFQIKSLEKFIPQRQSFSQPDDDHIDITIELPTPSDGTELNYERLQQAFEKWKSEQPIKTDDNTQSETVSVPARSGHPHHEMAPRRLTEIMSDILAWPIEQKTPLECINYISDIKQQLAALL